MKTEANTKTEVYGIAVDSLIEKIVEESSNRCLEKIIPELERYRVANAPEPEPERITRKEAQKILQLSKVTMIKYEKLGILKPLRFGSRIFYRKADINEAFLLIKRSG